MILVLALGCSRPAPEPAPAVSPEDLQHHCDVHIGEPRVEQIADGVWVALGFDLANTTLIQTKAGNVVVDPGMSPARAEPVRDALLEVSPGPIAAVIYTHSHIDHVGGASAWVGEGTEIWATDALRPHFLEQYGMLVQSERRRGACQFGASVPDATPSEARAPATWMRGSPAWTACAPCSPRPSSRPTPRPSAANTPCSTS